jgi:hypothetical protein
VCVCVCGNAALRTLITCVFCPAPLRQNCSWHITLHYNLHWWCCSFYTFPFAIGQLFVRLFCFHTRLLITLCVTKSCMLRFPTGRPASLWESRSASAPLSTSRRPFTIAGALKFCAMSWYQTPWVHRCETCWIRWASELGAWLTFGAAYEVAVPETESLCRHLVLNTGNAPLLLKALNSASATVQLQIVLLKALNSASESFEQC